MLLPLAGLVDAPWRLPAPGSAAIAAIVALGAVSTGLAYVVYFRILAGAGAINVVLVTLLAPAPQQFSSAPPFSAKARPPGTSSVSA